jgi:plastocyanin
MDKAQWLGLVCALAIGGTLAAGESPKTHTVTIENMQFDPQTLTVQRGDRVVWRNKDLFPHTATADSKAFDSKAIESNNSWTYAATQAGEYAYLCTLHPTMKGRLIVR